jgi:hypothetical protein
VALDGLKKGRTDAVRVAVVVLQSVVVIRAGLKIVRDDRRAVIREDAQKDSVQEELGLTLSLPTTKSRAVNMDRRRRLNFRKA